MDIDNIRINYGPVNDYTHNSVISYVYDLPFGRGRRFVSGVNSAVDQLIGGWQVNGITTFRSGAALSMTSPVSNNRGNRAGNRPDRIKDGNLLVLRGPVLANWDLSVFKNFPIKEQMRLQFRWEMFNAFNHVNYQNPSTNTGDARFARISSAMTARQMQMALKLLF